MAVRMLESEVALSEVHLAGDAGFKHPLKRAIHGRPADLVVFGPDQIHQVVGAQMPLLPEEHVHDEVALAGPLAARLTQRLKIGGWCFHLRTPAA